MVNYPQNTEKIWFIELRKWHDFVEQIKIDDILAAAASVDDVIFSISSSSSLRNLDKDNVQFRVNCLQYFKA